MEFGVNYFDFGTENVNAELIGGFGFGSGERRNVRGDYTKPFIQINAGLVTDVFDTGISFRTAYVNFHNLENNSGLGDKSASLFFEPAASSRLGFQKYKT